MTALARTMKRLLTPQAAARLAGVSPRTITRWQDTARLTEYRTIGGHRRVDEDELRALLAEIRK